jgi:hypothetical protein
MDLCLLSLLSQSTQAHNCPQLKRFRTLAPGNLNRFAKTCFSLSLLLLRQGQQQLPLAPMQIFLISKCVHQFLLLQTQRDGPALDILFKFSDITDNLSRGTLPFNDKL